MISNPKLTTPVAFFLFNRPEATKRVFEEIKKAQPSKLFVVADGPRTEAESLLCQKTRSVIDQVDWECEVQTNYSDINLGCKKRVSSGLDWVFEHNEQAIILEDDCLPDQSFFFFCQELLEKYKNDPQVMHISGDNFQATNQLFHCEESYYFTQISHIWGWASWRRAWKYYDVDIKQWPKLKQQGLLNKIFKDDGTVARWEEKFDDYYDQKISSWDGQWSLACFANSGFCIAPKLNLISNIGFSNDATHQIKDEQNKFSNIPRHQMEFPLIHPDKKIINLQAENFVLEYLFGVHNYRGLGQRIRRFFRKTFPAQYIFLKKFLSR